MTAKSKSMWGAWLPRFVAALNEVEPTKAERDILLQAAVIKRNHRARVQSVLKRFVPGRRRKAVKERIADHV